MSADPADALHLELYRRGAPSIRVDTFRTEAARRLYEPMRRANGVGNRDAALAAALATLPATEAAAWRSAMVAADPDRPPAAARPVVTLEDLGSILSATVWLWSLWLPRGYITLLAGGAGAGKSMVAMWLLRSLTQGTAWPRSDQPTGLGGPVVWVDTEASQALVFERADRFGLSRRDILMPSLDPGDPLCDLRLDTPEGFAELERLVTQPDPRPALVVIDSLRGAHDADENDSALNALMRRLAVLARDHKIAVLILHHLRKANSLEKMDVVTLDRVRGSTAIVAMARVVWAIDHPNPANRQHLRLSVIKSNLATSPPPIGFRIAEDALTFGDAPQAPRTETLAERAEDLLRRRLKNDPQREPDLIDAAKQEDISERSLRRAKKYLGVVSRKTSEGWLWALPSPRDDAEDE